MSSVFIRLGQGGSVSYKDGVATYADLPMTGNSVGDVRAVVDSNELFIWDGTQWNATGGGGGGSPGGSSGSIQFNSGGVFAGSPQLQWDNTGKILNLNGLAIRALSSNTTLLDNQSIPASAISYSSTTYKFSIIEYSLTRNGNQQVGVLLVTNDSSNASLTNAFADLYNDLGVDFSAVVSGGSVHINYTTTNTGFNATLRYHIRQWS